MVQDYYNRKQYNSQLIGKFLHYGLNGINYGLFGAFWGWGSGHFLLYPQKAPQLIQFISL